MPEAPSTQTLNYSNPRNTSPLTRFLNRLPRPSLITIILILLTAASGYWLRIDHAPWIITRQFLGNLPQNAPQSALSPDGTQLLAILPDRQTLRIYDLPTGNALRDFHRPAGQVTTAHFSPDATRIWSTGTDQHAILWDATTGKLVASLYTNEFIAASGSPFSSDSKWVTFCDSQFLRVHDARTGAQITEILTYGGLVYPVFSPDSHYLTGVSSHPKDVLIWETKTWQITSIITVADGSLAGRRRGLAFAPDSKSLAITAPPGVDIWDAAANRSARALSVPGQVEGCSYSPDGRFLLTSNDRVPQQVWDMTTRTLVGNLRGGGATISPDGRLIAVTNGNMREIDSFPALIPQTIFPDHGRMAWLPDSQSFISQPWPYHNPAIHDSPIAIFHRRRPEALYGILWLPQFWLALFTIAAALHSIIRDLKSWRKCPPGPTYITPWRP